MTDPVRMWALRSACAAAVLAVAGCSASKPHQTSPPPDAYEEPESPELLGGAPGEDADAPRGYDPGPEPEVQPLPPAAARAEEPPRRNGRIMTYRRADGTLVTAMRPVPNPEDLSPRDRRRVFGGAQAEAAPAPRAERRPEPRPAPRVERRAEPRLAYAPPPPRPQPQPQPAPKPAPRASAPVVAPAPELKVALPVKAPPKPVTQAPLAKAPQPVFPPAGLVAPEDPKLAALQAAVARETAAGARLTAPEAAAGQARQVTLSLPQSLLASLQREAAKLGLAKAARTAEASATLSGQGYQIQPAGPQTAQLKAGEAAVFNWNVTPQAGQQGPLKAQVDAALTGAGAPQRFSLAAMEQALSGAGRPAAGSALDRMTPRGMPDLQFAGVRIPARTVLPALLVLLLIIVLAALSRVAGERRRQAEQRRRHRGMVDFPRDDLPADRGRRGPAGDAPTASAIFSRPPTREDV